jgi:hypothetical protein
MRQSSQRKPAIVEWVATTTDPADPRNAADLTGSEEEAR